ncbi:MAG: hypothetical protein E7Y34_02110 [Mycoplasma sp.]|nr:hypothetical protein [Mycoplasma sp.]
MGHTETGFINTAADDFTDIKGFIKNLITVVGIKWKKYVPKLDEEISSDDNGYFFYFLDEYGNKKSVVLRVFVNYYNNDGNYQKDINYSFSSGNIRFQLLHMQNTIYGASKVYGWTKYNRKYKLINTTEYEWYSKFRSKLDNYNSLESSWWFDPNNFMYHIPSYIAKQNVYWESPDLWETFGVDWHYDGDDHFVFEFGLENKDHISNGRKYVLTLGGTGDIRNMKKRTNDWINATIRSSLNNVTENNSRARLNFNLYRSDDWKNTNSKLLLPIGKGKRYHFAKN